MSIINHHSATTLFSHLTITPTTTSKTPQNHLNPSFFFFQTKSLPQPLHSFTFHCHNPQQQQQLQHLEEDDEEEQVLGDCLVFEEGIFQEVDHPSSHIQQSFQKNVVKSEDLIPPKWKEIQAEINISKKERRKRAQEMEFGSKLQKRKQGLKPIPIGYSSHKEYKAAKLRDLNPVVLDNPDTLLVESDDGNEDESEIENEGGVSCSSGSSSRVVPRNPKMAVYGRSLDDISRFLNSGLYDPEAAKDPQGARKLFTKEEKVLMNRRVPDLAAVTSRKWQPLHTLAASGEFYLVDTLMKYSGDINVPNQEGLTAIHKAILGKKQAICNYLLRNSANPFVRDKDGATLMHYAVRTASTQMIKVLLLYNVDINLQDNDGWTSLHLAVQARRTDLVRLLLIKKADQTLKNQDGLSPLDLCLYSGRDTRTYELIRLLKLPPKPRKYAQLME